MLKERAVELVGQIDTLRQIRTGNTTAITLKTRKVELERNLTNLIRASQKMILLHNAEILVPVNAGFSFAQKTEWERIRDAQATNANYISSPEGLTAKKTAQQQFDELIKQLEASCEASWQNYATQELPQVDTFLLDVFAKDTSSQEMVQKIRASLTRIQTSASRFPESDITIKVFREHCNIVRKSYQELVGDSLPIQVKTFFEIMAKEKRVPLHALTPEVQQWIEDKNLTNGFKIVIG